MVTTVDDSQVPVNIDGVIVENEVIHPPAVHGELEIDEAVLECELTPFTCLHSQRIDSIANVIFSSSAPNSRDQGQDCLPVWLILMGQNCKASHRPTRWHSPKLFPQGRFVVSDNALDASES